MKNTPTLALCALFTLALTVAGCSSEKNGKKLTATIDKTKYTLEKAVLEEERAKGLSKRTKLAEKSGMIFFFDQADYLQFWMKDTHIPLQIIFINGCEIVDIQEMAVEKDPASPEINYRSKAPADKAIELNSGSAPQEIIGEKIEELCEY